MTDAEMERMWKARKGSRVTPPMAQRTAEAQPAFFVPHLHPDVRLLDCGCATGNITLGLADIVAPGEVIGIDIGSERLERAREFAADQGITNVRFRTASV